MAKLEKVKDELLSLPAVVRADGALKVDVFAADISSRHVSEKLIADAVAAMGVR